MRIFAIAADIALGLILGVFVYAALVRISPVLAGRYQAAAVIALSVLLVLFRRPNGALSRSDERRPSS